LFLFPPNWLTTIIYGLWVFVWVTLGVISLPFQTTI
jgi:hypothetical protein